MGRAASESEKEKTEKIHTHKRRTVNCFVTRCHPITYVQHIHIYSVCMCVNGNVNVLCSVGLTVYGYQSIQSKVELYRNDTFKMGLKWKWTRLNKNERQDAPQKKPVYPLPPARTKTKPIEILTIWPNVNFDDKLLINEKDRFNRHYLKQ